MKQYFKNPRTLSEKQFKLLKRDLEELGDLSGIVHDLNSDEIIGGNQRSKVFDLKPEMITTVDRFDPPTRTGTVAAGYVDYGGERFGYRAVRWTPKQCEKANIVANKSGGTWNMEVLVNEFDVGDLKEWGFEDVELDIKLPDVAQEDGEIPEPPADPVSRPGDLWMLGEHRLFCGDSTNQQHVEKLLGGGEAVYYGY